MFVLHWSICVLLVGPAANAQDQAVEAPPVEIEVSFTGLSRQPRPWYLKPEAPVAEASVCAGSDRSGRPVGISAVFPSETRKVALYFRVDERTRKTRAQAGLRHKGAEIRHEDFSVPGRRYWTWKVDPKGARTFSPGLYTFELVLDGALLAALDFVVTSTPQVDPMALRQPEYTHMPPPPRLFTSGEAPAAETEGPVAAIIVTKPIAEPDTEATAPAPETGAPVEGADTGDTSGEEPTADTPTADSGTAPVEETEATAGADSPPAGPPADVDSKRDVIEGLVQTAQSHAPPPPPPQPAPKPSATPATTVGGLLGDLVAEATGIGAVVELVTGLFTTKPHKPSQFTVQKPQTSERFAERMLEANGFTDALGGRRAVTHAAAMASDSRHFGRGILLLPLELRPDESGILALLIINDVSVSLNDAPVAVVSGFEFRFRGDPFYTVAVRIDPGPQSVEVLGRDGEPLVAGPGQMAVPEAQARDPYATIHQVISQDDVGDRAVAICSITPGLEDPADRSGVFPLLLSRLRK